MKRPFAFGSQTRAADGCIVTFELPNGDLVTERFNEIVRTRGSHWQRASTREDGPYVKQAAARADELGAKITCISTPQTILTDLKGTRGSLDDTGVRNAIWYPEIYMLGKIKRLDLYKPPTNGQTDGSIRQVKQRKPTRTGLRGD
jgi:hypothetical protein